MILKILIGLGTAFALYWIIQIKKIFPAIITIGMIVGIVLALLPSNMLQTPGYYLYMGFVAFAFFYGLAIKELKAGTRITICLMSASIFAYWLWKFNHWHGNALLAPIFVLLVALVSIISKVKLKNELGFLTIITIDAIAIIIENWLKAS